MDRSTQVFRPILHISNVKFLLAFKEGVVDDPDNALSSWINGSDCCGWEGVGCDVITREVVTLSIRYGGLNGTLNEVYALHQQPFDRFHSIGNWHMMNSFLTWPPEQFSVENIGCGKQQDLRTYTQMVGEPFTITHSVLRANYLEGEIPLDVTSIKSLQILDVSHNNLSGPIPHNLAMLSAMTHISQQTGFQLSTGSDYYREEVQITNKGQIMSYTYGTILSLVICIDLSQNHLTWSVPSAIQELNGLITLNLSRNHLSGDISDVFGFDMQLNSLDLSHNQLSGKVPESLGFPDSYLGNPCLCGPPLNTSCWHGAAPPTTEDDDEDKDETENELLWYGGLLLSHAVGFWVMFAVLFFKRERRRKCLRVMDRVAVPLLGRIGYW
eukprot:Gb_17276 [translate_table: standard]